MAIEATSLIGGTGGAGRSMRTVRSPDEHQGIRDALRDAFIPGRDLPYDITALLARLS